MSKPGMSVKYREAGADIGNALAAPDAPDAPDVRTTMLEVRDLTVRYGDLVIVDQVSFRVKSGQWLMVVGPNGAGKSTIVGAISGGVSYGGHIECIGKDIKAYKPQSIAKIIGVLSQRYSVSYPFSVGEVVRMGRYAHSKGLFAGGSDADAAAVARAVELTGLESFLDHSVLTLSGGELQRTFLAQLFAQDPKLLILDEPTNHLDLVYQKQVFALIGEWLKTPGRAVISVVHDLSLARAYGTEALLLHEGRIVAQGAARETLSSENLNNVYAMDVFEWMRTMLAQWREEA
ncbi:MAG: ABC transporter ATP-binding protein [Clostridiales Family XIII bacterium]|jgi:iron complex transport system ATP-binding protein|nr:ABC transporter ATP-binding protein [Clostridiales Family XIII bacterium]